MLAAAKLFSCDMAHAVACLFGATSSSCVFLLAAEAPPELQSIRPPSQALPPANQPVQSYRMQTLGSFDDEPAIITCTQCRATGQTYTYKVHHLCMACQSLHEKAFKGFLARGSQMSLGGCAGERMLCVVQRYHLHFLRMLAMCLDAILCWVMQRHSSQMQQLWSGGRQACLG